VGILGGGGGDIGSSAAAAATSRLNYNHNQSNNSSSVQLMSMPKRIQTMLKMNFFQINLKIVDHMVYQITELHPHPLMLRLLLINQR